MPFNPRKTIKKLVKRNWKSQDEYYAHLDELEALTGHPDVEVYLEAAQKRGLAKSKQLLTDLQSEAELYRRLVDDN